MGAKFRDGNGNDWALKITVGTLKRVEAEAGVKLGELLNDGMKPLAELMGDPVKFVEVLYAIIQPQVSREQFADAIDGDAAEDAVSAFMEALADFSPRQRRPIIRALAEKANKVMAAESAVVMEELGKITEESVREKIRSSVADSSRSAIASPGSAE